MSVALLVNRGLHKRPGGWSPKELGTLDLWLDADDATTITLSTGVSQWDDKSGNARHMTQATGANQPAYVTGARNGRAALRFDGSNDAMSAGDTMDLLTADLSLMVVGLNNAATATGDFVSKTPGTGGANGNWRLRRDNMSMTPFGTVGDGGLSTSLMVVGAVLDRATALRHYRNGSETGNTTSGYPQAATSYNVANPLMVGGRASATTPSQPLNGDVCEVVASLAAWTTDERQKVEGYLAHKWGLTASLPSDHPWKAISP